MATAKNYTTKHFNGTDWDIMYPKTTAEQVIESESKKFVTTTEKAAIEKIGEIEAKVDAFDCAASDILEKIKTVDGEGSGLDADTLDGKDSSEFLQVTSSLDATKLTGVIPISSMPPAALERLTVVADETARLALTVDIVQIGDIVKVTDSGKMYYIKDDTKLNTTEGYEEFAVGTAASVPWSGITDKPITVAESGLTDAATTALATTEIDGLMSKTDKAKLAELPTAENIPTFIISANAPTTPKVGDFWFEITTA